MMTKPLWTPNADRIAKSQLARFAKSNGLPVDYDPIWRWSIDHPDRFWRAIWTFCAIKGDIKDPVIVNQNDIISAEFFPAASLNYAENLLSKAGNGSALIFRGENGHREEWSWDKLRDMVSVLQQALISRGIAQGDRIAGYVPNAPMTIAMMLAVTSLGAVWSSCSPDFGYNGVCDRFGQIEPKLLFACDGYSYNGKTHRTDETAARIAQAIPSITETVIFPFLGDQTDAVPGTTSLAEFVKGITAKPVTFTRVGFNAPLFILYSSGTTGLPKCIVHSVGGTLLQHAKEHRLQCDIGPDDRLFYFTTCGWMMWNWLVSGLATGATLVLYDGSPFFPDGYCLPKIIDEEHVTHFGTSAKYLDACAKADIRPIDHHEFGALRTIFSTGSPLSADGFRRVYSAWKKDLCLSSIAGGTDIVACFVGGSPIDPVYAGQCQKRMLGMDVRVVDDEMNSLVEEQGELICANAHPSQPIGFWNDPDGRRYRDAYFARFENVWHHGDFVKLTKQGGMVFFGRSDAVLNPGGVRIGTAEIYRQVERIDQVVEGLVIGQQWDNDVRVVLFVILREGITLNAELTEEIKSVIRKHATPRHVPAKIIQVADIPRTKSGKITELAVRDVVHGRSVKNTESMANPEALLLYKDLDALKS